ncbi:ATP-binding protein [Actinomadura sp. KC216]|uniref:ATP-binding protein n=1 Tax=Actinomadura sp. KC216 TaxID=2530370 RepID=UPI001048EFEF|nr:ATP-binding protein [Actinomadura sp. KC216]TDB85429.1 ATP-binding protein [Actinomadura sp. KC216]
MSGDNHTIELPSTLAEGTTAPNGTASSNGTALPNGTAPSNGAPPSNGAAILLGELTLPAEHEAVPQARRFSRSVTTGSDIGHVGDDAEVLVSELVTNAVRHAAAVPGTVLSLRMLRAGDRLRIEVHDQSAGVPRTRFADGGGVDLMEETGRGWFLVAIMADRHGTDHTPSGKAVWCEVGAWPRDPRPGR